jgi:hypothetical protein
MITCSRPECQTAAGCKCGQSWDYPVRLPMRKALSEYTDAELRNELHRWATLARGRCNCPTGLGRRAELPIDAVQPNGRVVIAGTFGAPDMLAQKTD